MKSHKLWICENQRYKVFANWTLASRRKDCIAAMCGEAMNWEEIKSYGWNPVKVKVTIEKIEK